jgi:Lipopolysaccharide-assembly
MRRFRSRRDFGLRMLAIMAASVALPSCSSDGNFTLFGYTTRPNYDPCIRTVRVPIFKNETMRQGLEFELTKAVVREIEAKTTFKVVSGPGHADTELSGTIQLMNKNVVLPTPLNEIRVGETVMVVALQWKDLRTGEYLTRPKAGPGSLPPDALPGAQLLPPPPVIVTSTADFAPELGESITTAQQKNINRLAIQIVSMMEKPW